MGGKGIGVIPLGPVEANRGARARIHAAAGKVLEGMTNR